MEYEVREGVDDREDDGPENCHPKSVDFEAFDEAPKQPQKKSVNDEREDTKRQEVDRKSQKKEYRPDRDIDQPPHERQDHRRPKTLYADPRHDIRQCQKRQRTDQPLEQ